MKSVYVEFFAYCKLGCTFVRTQTNSFKSYTCKLQKELYKDNPKKYPPFSQEEVAKQVKTYCYDNKISSLEKLENFTQKEQTITAELYVETNVLSNIIKQDEVLKRVYSSELFYLEVDDIKYLLHSPILKNKSQMVFLSEESKITLYFQKDIFSIASQEFNELNNYLHLMLLSDNLVVYGEEQRLKQEHLFDYSLYKNTLLNSATEEKEYFKIEISHLFKLHQHLFCEGVKYNLFFTTKAMREYHYLKQKKNAFYHIGAINLPFTNIEFFWI